MLTQEIFLKEFEQMAAPLYPDALLRSDIALSMWEHRESFKLSNSADVWPKLYSCRFIEPGLVHYNEYGTVLVQKPVLDKMCPSFVGKPVVNVVHKNINPANFRNEADGVITKVWFNQNDGWYWAEFLVWDESTQRNCESDAYSVSCAYSVSNANEKSGEYHNIRYTQEVLDGEYTHMAVVANPRYEGARIVYNSKGGSMKMFNWFKKGESKQVADIENSLVEIDGKKVSVKTLVDVHNATEKSKVDDLSNMADETIIEIDGKEMTLANLKESYRVSLKNAEDDDDKKKKEKEEADRKNAEDEEKKKKDDEMKNAADAEAKAAADAKTKAGTEHFNSLKDVANKRGEPQQATIVTRRELAAKGKESYGEIKK